MRLCHNVHLDCRLSSANPKQLPSATMLHYKQITFCIHFQVSLSASLELTYWEEISKKHPVFM